VQVGPPRVLRGILYVSDLPDYEENASDVSRATDYPAGSQVGCLMSDFQPHGEEGQAKNKRDEEKVRFLPLSFSPGKFWGKIFKKFFTSVTSMALFVATIRYTLCWMNKLLTHYHCIINP
jgi:hypothetical protein